MGRNEKLVARYLNDPEFQEVLCRLRVLGANFVTISALGLLRLGAEDFRRVEALL